MDNQSPTANREIVTERVIDALCEVVWNAWVDRKSVDSWWGPKGFTTTTEEMDVRQGGCWRYIMHSIDGIDFKNYITYLEVIKPKSIVYHHGVTENDTDGFHVTVTFDDINGKTRVVMVQVFPSEEDRDHAVNILGAVEGGKQTLERLALLVEMK